MISTKGVFFFLFLKGRLIIHSRVFHGIKLVASFRFAGIIILDIHLFETKLLLQIEHKQTTDCILHTAINYSLTIEDETHT